MQISVSVRNYFFLLSFHVPGEHEAGFMSTSTGEAQRRNFVLGFIVSSSKWYLLGEGRKDLVPGFVMIGSLARKLSF